MHDAQSFVMVNSQYPLPYLLPFFFTILSFVVLIVSFILALVLIP